MESVYVTLYPSDDSLVNGQVLHVHLDCWDVRLSAPLQHAGTIPATFWLNPAPVNCNVCIVGTSEDPVTGELRARFFPLDMTEREERSIIAALPVHPHVIDEQVRGERRRVIG